MSKLTGTGIRTTATKLGLPHLADGVDELARRAEEGKLGYSTSSTWCCPRNSR